MEVPLRTRPVQAVGKVKRDHARLTAVQISSKLSTSGAANSAVPNITCSFLPGSYRRANPKSMILIRLPVFICRMKTAHAFSVSTKSSSMTRSNSSPPWMLRLEDDVEFVLVVERIVQLDQPRMVQAAHDVNLPHHVAPVFLLLVRYDLGRQLQSGRFLATVKHRPERAPAQLRQDLELLFRIDVQLQLHLPERERGGKVYQSDPDHHLRNDAGGDEDEIHVEVRMTLVRFQHVAQLIGVGGE
uniref:Uncharacterized protein n=1 Tax=Anopheles farauti TaxID=69004 RepID=A0A182QGL8_9DIPT